jgi:hypothetical protein
MNNQNDTYTATGAEARLAFYARMTERRRRAQTPGQRRADIDHRARQQHRLSRLAGQSARF